MAIQFFQVTRQQVSAHADRRQPSAGTTSGSSDIAGNAGNFYVNLQAQMQTQNGRLKRGLENEPVVQDIAQRQNAQTDAPGAGGALSASERSEAQSGQAFNPASASEADANPVPQKMDEKAADMLGASKTSVNQRDKKAEKTPDKPQHHKNDPAGSDTEAGLLLAAQAVPAETAKQVAQAGIAANEASDKSRELAVDPLGGGFSRSAGTQSASGRAFAEPVQASMTQSGKEKSDRVAPAFGFQLSPAGSSGNKQASVSGTARRLDGNRSRLQAEGPEADRSAVPLAAADKTGTQGAAASGAPSGSAPALQAVKPSLVTGGQPRVHASPEVAAPEVAVPEVAAPIALAVKRVDLVADASLSGQAQAAPAQSRTVKLGQIAAPAKGWSERPVNVAPLLAKAASRQNHEGAATGQGSASPKLLGMSLQSVAKAFHKQRDENGSSSSFAQTGNGATGALGLMNGNLAPTQASPFPQWVSAERFSPEVAQWILTHAGRLNVIGSTSIAMTLVPEQLGKVRVTISSGKSGHLNVKIAAATEAARSVLSQHVSDLQQQLATNGYEGATIDVQLDQGGGGGGDRSMAQNGAPQSVIFSHSSPATAAGAVGNSERRYQQEDAHSGFSAKA